jgi:ABC-type uncharacterized transport system auxiliary subunit
MIKSIRCRPLFPLLLLLLSACAGAPPVPEDHYYRLIVSEQPSPNPNPATTGVLKVAPIKAYGIYRERALLYALETHPEGLQQHRYHYWIDTPMRLIRDQLVSFLRTGGAAGQVAGSQVTLSGDLRLKLTLKQFERVVSADGSSRVRVALDGVVATDDGQTMKLVSYYRERAVEENSIPASVTAFSQALNDIYFDVLKDLRNL